MTRQEYQKQWRLKNAESIRQYQKEYGKNNIDKLRAYKQRPEQKAKQSILAKRWRNSEHGKQKRREYLQRPDVKERTRNRKKELYHQMKPEARRREYMKRMDDVTFKALNKKRAAAYYHSHRAEAIIRAKCYRAKPSSQANRKQYIKKNRNRIYSMHKIVAKRWSAYQRDNLTDTYCIQLIRTQTGLHRKQITKEMIEQKRLSIKIKRKTNEINAKINPRRDHGRLNSVFSRTNLYGDFTPEYAKHYK